MRIVNTNIQMVFVAPARPGRLRGVAGVTTTTTLPRRLSRP